ncbi:MAG: hypothetical protein P4M09_29745 [Devosia sp.]|nr:hypothetical protein [Devosia sp.]
MIEVNRIPIPNVALRGMPLEERALFLTLGYVANQLSMLQKLMNMISNREPTMEVDQYASAAQTQMLLRLMVGAVHEAYERLRKDFLSSPLSREYLPLLDAGGTSALNDLKKLFGGSNLISKVRNSFAYHLPSQSEVDAAYERACADPELGRFLQMYMSEHGFNSLFLWSDVVFLQAIGIASNKESLAVAQNQLMREVVKASADLIEFAHAFVIAAWKQYVGPDMVAMDRVRIEGAQHL